MSEQRSNQSWLQLVCFTQQQHHEAIEAAMEEANALSITWQDAKDTPVLEPLPGETPLWDNLIITALFDADADLSFLSETLRKNKEQWKISDFLIETVEDQDWERVWMKDFHPMKFGDKLWIYPSNHEVPDNNDVKILLDPGLAFGTGTHPTTALCLEWLDQNPPKNKTLVDYGCGSGVLALAAVKLGAKRVVATDIDPQALTATKDNMLRNAIEAHAIDCYLPDEMHASIEKIGIDKGADLVLANILCGPLHELYPLLSSLTGKQGQLVLSGILSEQAEPLIETYAASFESFEIKELDGWVRISATKKR